MEMNLKPAMIFKDHMVLQSEKQIPIWGTGKEGSTVTVSILGKQATTVVTDGNWKVSIPPLSVSEGAVMVITSEEDAITIQDVAIGEVWLAGGQSNMEFFLRYDAEHDEAVEKGENPLIRFFDYPKVAFEGQLEMEDYSEFGFWRECTKENMDYYSAVGYYFASKLQKQYQVPIGIVGCNWGGTTSSCWMGEEYLKDNEGKVWLDDYEAAIKDLDLNNYEKEYANNPLNHRGKVFGNPLEEGLLRGLEKEDLMEMAKQIELHGKSIIPAMGPKNAWRPCGLYRSMLKKVAPYAIRGVIWYQGESDDIHASVYATVFSNMIRCWRDLWSEEIPFLFVQLAALRWWFIGNIPQYPIVRTQQEWVSKHIPNTWMASITDAGMEWDVHPKKKRPVGERLALLARGHIYGEEILCDAPECKGISVEDGQIKLEFLYADGGLTLIGDQIQALEILRNGQEILTFDAVISDNCIIIKSDELKVIDKIQVKFASTEYYEVNIYNAAGIPMKPFVIEN